MRILKFEAPWCTKCHQMTQLMSTMDLPYNVEHIDVDKHRDVSIEYGVRGIPHMIVMDDDNNIVKRIGGVLTKEQLNEALGLQ